MFVLFQSLQNSHSHQREFGDGQRDGQKKSQTAYEEENVILSSIKNRGIQGQEITWSIVTYHKARLARQIFLIKLINMSAWW